MPALLALAPARALARIDAPGAVTAGPESLEVDLSHHLRALGAEGAFVLHDLSANRIVVHDATRASRAPYDLRGWVPSVEAGSWRV